jgi:hypothetical protein
MFDKKSTHTFLVLLLKQGKKLSEVTNEELAEQLHDMCVTHCDFNTLYAEMQRRLH